jgi:hypothetical protein
MARVGFPIVEATPNGEFIVTKHDGTGGRVNVQSVKEQLLYEMGDPKAYITPDVVADFSSIQLSPDGENRVKVFGIKGNQNTEFYRCRSLILTDTRRSVRSSIRGPMRTQRLRRRIKYYAKGWIG